MLNSDVRSIPRRRVINLVHAPANRLKTAAVSVLSRFTLAQTPERGDKSVLSDGSESCERPHSQVKRAQPEPPVDPGVTQPLYLTKVALTCMRKDHLLVGLPRRSWLRNRDRFLKTAILQAPQGAFAGPPADAVSLLRGATAPNPAANVQLSPLSQSNPYVGAPGGTYSPAQNPINSYGPLNASAQIGGGMFGQKNTEGGSLKTAALAGTQLWEELQRPFCKYGLDWGKRLPQILKQVPATAKQTLNNIWNSRTARGALIGGGLGLGVGGLDYAMSEDPNPSLWKSLALGGGAGATYGGIVGGMLDLARIAGENEHQPQPGGAPNRTAEMSLRDEIEDYYRGAPGGLDAAVEEAQRHVPRAKQLGLQPWEPGDVDIKHPVTFVDRPTLDVKGRTHGGRVQGVASSIPFSSSSQIHVAAPGGQYNEGDLRHELTHGALQAGNPAITGPGPNIKYNKEPLFEPDKNWPGMGTWDRIRYGISAQDVADRKAWYRYAGTPEEMKAWTADAKREWVQRHGQHMRNQSDAADAVKEWLNKHPLGDPEGDLMRGMMSSPRGKETLLQQLLQVVMGTKGGPDVSKVASAVSFGARLAAR